jgi:hypothetical protein
MPTDNPKISLYVPQQIFDRFKSFQEERKLSMSQAGIVIIAEYFGIEETIKEITEGTTIGGVTLAEFENLKQRLEKLEKQVERSKTTSNLLVENQDIDKLIESKPVSSLEQHQNQLKLTGEENISISVDLLAKRLGIKNSKSVSNKRNEIYKNDSFDAEDKFCEWTRKKDFDDIGWKPIKEGIRVNYTIKDELSSELLSKLKEWIADNAI